MAAITVTTSVNKDDAAASTRLNGEAATINGGTFVINSDVRWGQNTAVLGNIVISSTSGGTATVDATTVWQVPFSASTGTVPTLAAINSNPCTGVTSGATGELLRVWNNTAKTPLASGTAMPATGWIKLRSKTGAFTAGERINLPGGATITISSSGQRSWLHIVGADTSSIQTSGAGIFNANGDWYELGTTTGVAGQTLNYPVADICPAIQVETAAGSGVYEWWLNAGARWNTATKYIPTDDRGKFFGCTTAGVITLSATGANACGKIPAAGCKVRIPNIIVSYSNATNWATNVVSTVITTRYRLLSSNYGRANINFISGGLYIDIADGDSFSITNCAFFDQIRFNNIYPLVIDNVAVGFSGSLSQNAVDISNAYNGGTISNVTAAMYTSTTANSACINITDISNFTISNILGYVFGAATTTTRSQALVAGVSIQRTYNTEIGGVYCIGARAAVIDSAYVNISNVLYCDAVFSTTQVAAAQSAVELLRPTNVNVDGVGLLFPAIANVQPYVSFVAVTNALDVDIRNVGAVQAPLNCGTVNNSGYLITVTTSKNVAFYRIHGINTRTGQILSTDDTVGLFLIDVRSDFADAGQLIGKDVTVRGCSKTPYMLAQAGNHGRPFEEGYSSATVGYIMAMACNITPTTASQVVATAGNPKFTSIGHIYFPTIGDQVEWTMPYFALGHTALTGLTTTLVNPTFLRLEFQYDTGAGFNGTWISLTAANLIAIGAINPATGIKFKFLATATSNSALTRLTLLRVDTATSTSAQLNQQVLPALNSGASRTLTLTNIQPASEVRILDLSMNEIAGDENVVSGSFEYNYTYSANTVITVIVYNINYKDVRFDYQISNSDVSIPIMQSLDRNYT